MYDLVLKNCNVIDGTGNEPYNADIAIKDGKICSIASGILGGEKVIDVEGLTVTPGWIDSHSHSDRNFFTFPHQKEKVEGFAQCQMIFFHSFSISPS